MASRLLEAKEVFSQLRVPSAFGGAPDLWDEAMSEMRDERLGFLDLSGISARREAAGLPPERDPMLREMAELVREDTALKQFAWYMFWRMFVVPDKGVPWGAPDLDDRLGAVSGMFYELLALEFPVSLSVWHKRLSYPAEVTHDTLRQLAAFDSNHLKGKGCHGFYASQFVWLLTYLTNNYVRLGRFEYVLSTHYGVNAWKRESDGSVVALADDGTLVDGEGRCVPKNESDSAAWTAFQRETDEYVEGYPVHPSGRVLKDKVRLEAGEWSCCLRKGMQVLDLHIPAGGGMNWPAVKASFALALDFFAKHHPDKPFEALVCQTWFLDSRLEQLLPSQANILRFQRACYLVPVAARDGLWFVFFRDAFSCDPAGLPRDSGLRRIMADHISSGGKWNLGSMFMLRDDMTAPAEDCYRHRFVLP